jgi:hypothetical protein
MRRTYIVNCIASENQILCQIKATCKMPFGELQNPSLNLEVEITDLILVINSFSLLIARQKS